MLSNHPRHAAPRPRAPGWACGLLVLAPHIAFAHDTWLEPRPGPAGRVHLALTTGELFPAGETPVAAQALVDRGCTLASGRRVALRPSGAAPGTSLALQAAVPVGASPGTCWVQTQAFDVEVPARLVPTYLREIGASVELRQAWAMQLEQGQPWIERYTKHARISFAAAPAVKPAVARREAAAPVPPMALDIEIEDVASVRAGTLLRYRVLRDGRPLAGQAVELRGEMSPLGLWRRSDAEGYASVPVPFAGRWVLRATDLRPVAAPSGTAAGSSGSAGRWESRFVTHAFTAQPAPAPQPSMPNARSANHSSATHAMSTEPPTSTP